MRSCAAAARIGFGRRSGPQRKPLRALGGGTSHCAKGVALQPAATPSCAAVKPVQSPQPRSEFVKLRCGTPATWPQEGEAHFEWSSGAYMNAALSVYQHKPRSAARSCMNAAKNVDPVLCGAKKSSAGGAPLRLALAPQSALRGSEANAAPLVAGCSIGGAST